MTPTALCALDEVVPWLIRELSEQISQRFYVAGRGYYLLISHARYSFDMAREKRLPREHLHLLPHEYISSNALIPSSKAAEPTTAVWKSSFLVRLLRLGLSAQQRCSFERPTTPTPPLQTGWEFYERPQQGTWRRTGWIDDKYTILDVGRFHDRWENDYVDVSLSVTIQEDLDPLNDGQGHKTDEADENED